MPVRLTADEHELLHTVCFLTRTSANDFIRQAVPAQLSDRHEATRNALLDRAREQLAATLAKVTAA